MIRNTAVLLTSLCLASASSACGTADKPADQAAAQAPASLPPGHPPAGADAAPRLHGAVLDALHAGNYTYVQVRTDSGERWLAGPRLDVEVGDEVVFDEGTPMPEWHSESLNRTWGVVYFVQDLQVAGAEGDAAAAAMPPGHPRPEGGATAPVSGVEKLAGGQTVAEVHARRAELAGQAVALRGRVVKANLGILGTNWFHVQDGSGDAQAGTHDLTVTSPDEAQVGDLVSVRGTLALDKDFGGGYRYEVIVEDARLTVE